MTHVFRDFRLASDVTRRRSCVRSSSETPKDEWLRAAQACIDATTAALEFIKPGVTSHEADTAARAVTSKAGFANIIGIVSGYSIGVSYPPDWGEGEIISLQQNEPRVLQAGMTFHMPPLCLKYRESGIGFSESIRGDRKRGASASPSCRAKSLSSGEEAMTVPAHAAAVSRRQMPRFWPPRHRIGAASLTRTDHSDRGL